MSETRFLHGVREPEGHVVKLSMASMEGGQAVVMGVDQNGRECMITTPFGQFVFDSQDTDEIADWFIKIAATMRRRVAR